eukprot:2830594-Pyramimonas_sp.AAC.1
MCRDLHETYHHRRSCHIFFEHSRSEVVQQHRAKSGAVLDEAADRLDGSKAPSKGDHDACDEEASFEPE